MDLSSVTSYADAAPQLEETLSHVNITEDDPAVILNWDLEALQDFVARAIARDGAPDPPARPGWLRTFPPTTASLTDDIVTHLAQVAGGRFGVVVLAPNNLNQYANICELIVDIEHEPFMQVNFAAAPPDQRLARTGYLLDNRRVLQPVDRARTPRSPPLRQIFA
ncbi:hypothetical protein DVH05_016319 [Phytophthora capsici]|nr:hypothetical protein DVH05_017915 [Phytophthora capsici]KAG1697445.1 hypothetical protein DVH05_016319 [Phytophthora capsici]